MQKQNILSKNQQIIFDLIDKSSEPLKAYSILFNVQKKGIKAPLQVYRALDKLVEIGKIHKIESRNAFMACKNSKLYLLNFIPASSAKFDKYFDSLVLLISETCSQLSQIEKAVALEI